MDGLKMAVLVCAAGLCVAFSGCGDCRDADGKCGMVAQVRTPGGEVETHVIRDFYTFGNGHVIVIHTADGSTISTDPANVLIVKGKP